MSRFSTALANALEVTRTSQAAMCAATGIRQSPMSRYVRGTSEVGPQIAEKIIRALPSPQNAEVLAAYLADSVPADDLRHLVEVRPVTNGVREEEPALLPDHMPRELRSLLVYFAHKAVAHPEIRDMLGNLRTALEAD